LVPSLPLGVPLVFQVQVHVLSLSFFALAF
jgi:hypothetical protein